MSRLDQRVWAATALGIAVWVTLALTVVIGKAFDRGSITTVFGMATTLSIFILLVVFRSTPTRATRRDYVADLIIAIVAGTIVTLFFNYMIPYLSEVFPRPR